MNSTTYSTERRERGAECPDALGTVRTIITARGHSTPRQRAKVAPSIRPHGVLTGPARPSRQERAWLRMDVLRGYTTETAQKVCGCARLADVEVWRGDGEGVRMRGIMNCKSPMRCPRCGDRIARHRAETIEGVVSRWIAAGNTVFLASLTMRHRHVPLKDGVDQVLRAWSDMWLGRRRETWTFIGVQAAIRSLEATHGSRNGWHPHMHALIFAGPDGDTERIRYHLSAQWRARVDASEARGVRLDQVQPTPEDIRRCTGYVAKGATNELIYGHDKKALKGRVTPMELLDVRSRRAERLWQEWEQGVKGRRAHGWVGKSALVAVVGDFELDSSPADDDETTGERKRLLRLSAETWRDLRHIRAIAALLAIVRTGLDTRFIEAYDHGRRSESEPNFALLRLCIRRC